MGRKNLIIRSLITFLIMIAAMFLGHPFSTGDAGADDNLWSSSMRSHGRSSASPYLTENVIIVIIDGLRNSEAFEDPTHQYIPHIWNDMRPDGTIYTAMLTSNWPRTTMCHFSLLTGVRTNVELTFGHPDDSFRESHPTLFECYRKASALPMSETWIVSGKAMLSAHDYSLHPAWGEACRSNLLFDTGFDSETMAVFYGVALRDRPSLALINLRDVDAIGHGPFGATYEDYTDAIVLADTLVYRLWRNIQADPHYQNKTTLIVTSDHGRMAGENHNPHGGPNHSDRHVMFLALGPDIKKGAVIGTRGDLIDIPVTVAELLGFDMPYAEGRILHEMLASFNTKHAAAVSGQCRIDESRLTGTPEASLRPSISVNPEGVHVVWSERDGASDGEHRFIKYLRSADFGTTWTYPETVARDFKYYRHEASLPGSLLEDWTGEPASAGRKKHHGGTPLYADIHSHPDGRLAIAMNGYSEFLNEDNDIELKWGAILKLKDSSARTDDWTDQGFKNVGHLLDRPPGLSIDSEIWAAMTVGSRQLGLGRSKDTGSLLLPSIYLPHCLDLNQWLGGHHFYRAPSIVNMGGQIHLVFEINNYDLGRVFYRKYDTAKHQDLSTVRMDGDSGPSTGPRIAALNESIYVVWADYEGSPARWQVKFRKSPDGGATFEPALKLTSSSAGAWHPDIAVSSNHLIVIWEDYRDGNGEIYAILSDDAGETWSSEIRLTYAPSHSAYPRVAVHETGFYGVWQDYRDGNWEVYFLSHQP
jgi:hypothetical protein